MEQLTKSEAMQKLLRIQRYVLDQMNFQAFDLIQSRFLEIVQERKAEHKALGPKLRRAGRRAAALEGGAR